MKVVRISKRAHVQIEGGSLWIFANEFQTKMSELIPGEWVNFESQGGNFVGYGYVNPHSLIAGRVCSRTPVESRRSLLEHKIRESARKRKSWGCADSSYRSVFSESDGLPGLIVDAYTDGERSTLVASLTTAGMAAAKEDLVAVLGQWEEFAAIVLRADSSILNLEQVKPWVEVVRGDERRLRDAFLLEDDVWFAADFIGGQKTGFFLDQKDNRRCLKNCVQNRKASGKRGTRILDLCCYSGGWGLTALKAGAEHVTFVDQAADALELVKKGMTKNGFSENRARFAQADVFDFLKNDGEKFDIVIADPPAFVKSKKNLPQAARAYQKLNTQAVQRLAPLGLLFTSSCSFHFSEGDFEKILVAGLQESRRTGRVFHRGTQSEDHPWMLNRPESRYLKCFGIECLEES